jgi:hypothetical protein
VHPLHRMGRELDPHLLETCQEQTRKKVHVTMTTRTEAAPNQSARVHELAYGRRQLWLSPVERDGPQ